MKPKPRSEASQLDLFQAQLDQLLNLDHPLCVLAGKIDWNRFDVAFAGCYCPETGAGDEINAVLAAAGSNLQKLLRAIARALIFRLVTRPEPRTSLQNSTRPLAVTAA